MIKRQPHLAAAASEGVTLFPGVASLSEGALSLRNSEEFALLRLKLRHGSEARGAQGVEAVETRIWSVLSQIRDPQPGSFDPYRHPEEYFNAVLQQFVEFWNVMALHGEYSSLVRDGLDPCIERHLALLRQEGEKRGPMAVRSGMAEELAGLVSRFHEEIFGFYRHEMTCAEDYEHHLPGQEFSLFESFAPIVDRAHESAFYAHERRMEAGLEAALAPLKRGVQEHLDCLEDEATLYRGHPAVDPASAGAAVESAHVCFDDPVRRRAVMGPDADCVYRVSSESGLEPFEREVRAYGPTIREYLLEKLTGTPSLLDIGAGAGFLGRVLSESSLKADLAGVEWSKEAVKRANEHPYGAYVRRGSVYALPFADASFDAAISIEAQDTFEDQERALGEIARVVKPGGRFYHAAIAWPCLEPLKGFYLEKGYELFSIACRRCVRVFDVFFYFKDPSHAGEYKRLGVALEEQRKEDAGKAKVALPYWPSKPGQFRWGNETLDWSTGAKKLFLRQTELREQHATRLDKEAFRDILIEKSAEAFRHVGEVEKNGVTFYEFERLYPQ